MVAQMPLFRRSSPITGPMTCFSSILKLPMFAAVHEGRALDVWALGERVRLGILEGDIATSIDADELGAMTLMWARMNGRLAREEAITREVSMSFLPSAVRFGSVDRTSLSRTVFDMLFW